MFDSPLHDDQEALLPIVSVLVHVLDVDDVPALVLQKAPSEYDPNVRNHGEGPY